MLFFLYDMLYVAAKCLFFWGGGRGQKNSIGLQPYVGEVKILLHITGLDRQPIQNTNHGFLQLVSHCDSSMAISNLVLNQFILRFTDFHIQHRTIK